MSLTINEVPAGAIADAFDRNDGSSSFSLTAGRGYPGVILDVITDEFDGAIWIVWEDGNGEHTNRFEPHEKVLVFA